MLPLAFIQTESQLNALIDAYKQERGVVNPSDFEFYFSVDNVQAKRDDIGTVRFTFGLEGESEVSEGAEVPPKIASVSLVFDPITWKTFRAFADAHFKLLKELQEQKEAPDV